ncbi:MAG: HD domain-containing protein [Coprobacillus sp.]
MKLNKLAEDIFQDILNQGGQVYIVGGSVRDMVMGIDNQKDIDVEVYHLSYQELYDVLSRYGNVNTFGKSFAIMQLDKLKGYDFALPRKEIKAGVKHQDFDIIIDQNMSIEKAVLRRDLTINALMFDYQSQEIIDLYHGLDDIQNRIIRCVDKETFIEDPLRVLRIAQFIARFEMTVEKETFDLCVDMVKAGMLEHLSIERVYQEYCKILMSPKPSLGFEFLKQIHALPFYLQDLVTTSQRLDYHPEGDVFTHTMLVIDVAALMKEKTDEPLSFMWSCLLHDIGKPIVTTSDGHAPLHNEAGVEVFKKVNIIQSHKQREYISTMIMYHMHLMNMAKNNARDISYLRLLKKIDDKISMNDLIYISRCDKLGRGRVSYEQYDIFEEFIEDKLNRLKDKAVKPIINGNILIENGFDKSSLFKEILNEAYDLQLQGLNTESILRSLKKKYESR